MLFGIIFVDFLLFLFLIIFNLVIFFTIFEKFLLGFSFDYLCLFFLEFFLLKLSFDISFALWWWWIQSILNFLLDGFHRISFDFSFSWPLLFFGGLVDFLLVGFRFVFLLFELLDFILKSLFSLFENGVLLSLQTLNLAFCFLLCVCCLCCNFGRFCSLFLKGMSVFSSPTGNAL